MSLIAIIIISLDCFSQLHSYIVDLSCEHFRYVPAEPPRAILNRIPAGLPPFLDNTKASRELRSAYVQHLISKTLMERIFQPFLFTLEEGYDETDALLQTLSSEMRQKSVRREAFWRQQTLKAAYTTPDAKQSISRAANAVAKEIVEEIRYFTDSPRELEAVVRGVRRIVKLAVETWRRARIERELIVASFSKVDTNAEWEEYGAEQYEWQQQQRHRPVMLRLFPQIIREAGHEGLMDEQERVSGCVYSRGTLIYGDSPVIEARLAERSGRRDFGWQQQHARQSSGSSAGTGREIGVFG